MNAGAGSAGPSRARRLSWRLLARLTAAIAAAVLALLACLHMVATARERSSAAAAPRPAVIAGYIAGFR